jgi:HAD superfamily hydrolase (TIGR01490 family)
MGVFQITGKQDAPETSGSRRDRQGLGAETQVILKVEMHPTRSSCTWLLAPLTILPYTRSTSLIEERMARVAALFDMDLTLLDASSGRLYVRYLRRNGEIGLQEVARTAWWGILSRLGVLDMQEVIPKLLSDAAGDSEAEMRALCDRWFAKDVVPHITEWGWRQVAFHREQGHVVAIVSASTQFAVGPLAAYLGIPGRYVSTHLESKEGKLTGRVVPPVCFGPGKVVWAERFASEYGVDLGDSYFYTDSISDLPLLERVGHPVAVNPDPRLRRLARRKGWPIEASF